MINKSEVSQKRCSKCGKNKTITEFSRDQSKKDGYYSSCKDCVRKSRGTKKRIPVGFWEGKPLFISGCYLSLKGKRVHRIIAERKLGRKLKKNECVHHVDGDMWNNSLENIVIITKRKHSQIHIKNHPYFGKGHLVTLLTKESLEKKRKATLRRYKKGENFGWKRYWEKKQKTKNKINAV